MCVILLLVMANAANHRQPKAAQRGTSGAAFGCPSAFALLCVEPNFASYSGFNRKAKISVGLPPSWIA